MVIINALNVHRSGRFSNQFLEDLKLIAELSA